MKIKYQFELADQRELSFVIDLARPNSANLGKGAPAWTELSFQKCPTCPLAENACFSCPAAVDVTAIVSDFASLLSYDQAHVTVTAGDREIRRHCDVQIGLKSILGVVMATSGCPVLSKFRGMANFHLPFASLEETVVRTVRYNRILCLRRKVA